MKNEIQFDKSQPVTNSTVIAGSNLPLTAMLIVLPLLLALLLGTDKMLLIGALFTTTAGLWFTEALPLPATGLLVPVLATLYGVLEPEMAFNAFGSDVLYLFLGCFLITKSMEKHGLDRRIAYILLSYCSIGNSFFAINLVLALTSFLLSMWISNTSATAILTSVTLGILTSLESKISDKNIRHRMAIRLLLTCTFATSIGGIVTPIGSPPNMIAQKMLNQYNLHVSFLSWIMYGLPPALLMLCGLMVIFSLLFPLRGLSFPDIKQHFRRLLTEQGKMNSGEKGVARIFAITIILWTLPGILVLLFPQYQLIKLINSRLSMSIVGLASGLILFVLPIKNTDNTKSTNLSWEDAKSIDWGTLMLFGGGLTLGVLIEDSGLAAKLGNYIISDSNTNLVLMSIIIIVASVILSEFASNTASAAILIPLVLGSTIPQGIDKDVVTNLVLATTFATSFGFMLPVSTPPNAIVYATGRIPTKSMLKAGALLDLLGAIIISILFLFLPAFTQAEDKQLWSFNHFNFHKDDSDELVLTLHGRLREDDHFTLYQIQPKYAHKIHDYFWLGAGYSYFGIKNNSGTNGEGDFFFKSTPIGI